MTEGRPAEPESFAHMIEVRLGSAVVPELAQALRESGDLSDRNCVGYLNDLLERQFDSVPRPPRLGPYADQLRAADQIVSAARLIVGDPPDPDSLGLAVCYILGEMARDFSGHAIHWLDPYIVFALVTRFSRIEAQLKSGPEMTPERLEQLNGQAIALNLEYVTWRGEEAGDRRLTLFSFFPSTMRQYAFLYGERIDETTVVERRLVTKELERINRHHRTVKMTDDQFDEVRRGVQARLAKSDEQRRLISFYLQVLFAGCTGNTGHTGPLAEFHLTPGDVETLDLRSITSVFVTEDHQHPGVIITLSRSRPTR